MFLLLLIAPKQKNFCVTKDRVPLRGSAVRLAPALLLSIPARHPFNVSPLSLRDIPPSGGTSWKRLLLLYGYNRRSRFLSLPYRCLAVTHGRTLGSPRGRAVERSETERANVAAPPWGLQTASGSFYCNHTAKGAVFHLFPLDSGLSIVYITR